MKNQLPETYRHPLPNGLYHDMVLVRAGTFIMGSEEEEAWDDEQPEHLVRLTQDYYIGVYPVTQAVWKAVMAGHNPSYFRGDKRPVEGISWIDIVEGGQDEGVPESFLTRINKDFPVKEPGPAGFQFRLPTEAEWEYAAKGGQETAVKNLDDKPKAKNLYTLYAGSDKLKEVGWYDLNSHGRTKNVGMKIPNELGLYDMCGNVWEWCQDWFGGDFYQACDKKGMVGDPTGPQEGPHRVARGGSWLSAARYYRVSCRFSWPPSSRARDVGFRLVLSPKLQWNT